MERSIRIRIYYSHFISLNFPKNYLKKSDFQKIFHFTHSITNLNTRRQGDETTAVRSVALFVQGGGFFVLNAEKERKFQSIPPAGRKILSKDN